MSSGTQFGNYEHILLGTANVHSQKLDHFKYVHISCLSRRINSDFTRIHDLIHLFIRPFALSFISSFRFYLTCAKRGVMGDGDRMARAMDGIPVSWSLHSIRRHKDRQTPSKQINKGTADCHRCL